jgi:nucleosome binding factor SPN SPT16 subunit
MSSSPTVDPSIFHKNSQRLLRIISKSSDCDALSIPVGKYDSELSSVTKSISLFNYLFGIEFTDTVLFCTSSTIHIFSSKKKIEKYFKPGTSKSTSHVRCHVLSKKDLDANEKTIEDVFASLGDVKTLAISSKDRSLVAKSPVVSGFLKVESRVFSSSESKKENASRLIVETLSKKNDKELDYVKRSGLITSKLFRNGLIDMLEDVIDQDTKITHDALSRKVESLIENPKKIKAKYDPEDGTFLFLCFFFHGLCMRLKSHSNLYRYG